MHNFYIGIWLLLYVTIGRWFWVVKIIKWSMVCLWVLVFCMICLDSMSHGGFWLYQTILKPLHIRNGGILWFFGEPIIYPMLLLVRHVCLYYLIYEWTLYIIKLMWCNIFIDMKILVLDKCQFIILSNLIIVSSNICLWSY